MRQWAIILGLNEYQFLQPLNCAQQDAQAFYQFLIHEAGFRPEQCLLFTNTSPQSWGRPTLPTRDNLHNWIELLVQEYLQPEDTLWLFVSGCGVCYKGQDYLIPVDGHPSAIATTCISITSLLERLNTKLSRGSLWAMLDISRSQGMRSHENVGAQTAQITYQLKIPTILSCQPGQFSREVSSLGHGLFTIALLEGLRYQPETSIAALAKFLNDRLPELGEHYWQPGQKPLLICPPAKLNHPLLPNLSLAQSRPVFSGVGAYGTSGDNGSMVGNGMNDRHGSNGTNGYGALRLSDSTLPPSANISGYHPSAPAPSISSPSSIYPLANGTPTLAMVNGSAGQPNQARVSMPNSNPLPVATHPSPAASVATPEVEDSRAGLWKPILLWGGLISLGLAGGVIWRNWNRLWDPFQTPISKGSPVAKVAPPQVPINSGTSQSITSGPSASEAPASTNQEGIQPVSVSAGASGVVNGANSSPAGLGNSSPSDSPKTLPLDFAPIPGASEPPSSQEASEQKGEMILAHARKMIQSDQATPYRDAIDELRKISAQDPNYLEAQVAIEEWSQTILTIAQRRAEQKQMDIAVMAANLVPVEDAKRSPQAKAAIAQWCPAVRLLPGDTPPQLKAKEICSQFPI